MPLTVRLTSYVLSMYTTFIVVIMGYVRIYFTSRVVYLYPIDKLDKLFIVISKVFPIICGYKQVRLFI